MFSSALHFLLVTIFNLLTMLFLLRFLLQLFRASFKNPLAYMVVSLTDFAVKPTRKIIPSWGKLDLSTLFLALLAQFLLQLSLVWLRDFPLSVAGQSVWAGLIGMSFLGVLRTTLDVFFYAILLQVILSWVNPHTPIAAALDSLTKPILTPIQRLLQMLNVSVIKTLESQLLSLF
jgi:YggT family protein